MSPLLVSVAKFFAVTVLAGTIGYLIVPSILAFVLFGAIAIIAQFVLSWVLDRYEYVRRAQYEYQQRLDEQAILAANSLTVECAGCKTPHSIPIIATERNLFRCRKCEGENVIIVNAETALTTNIETKNA